VPEEVASDEIRKMTVAQARRLAELDRR